MSTLDHRLETVTGARLLVITDAVANLIAQLSELNELHEPVRKADLSARRPRREAIEKEHAFTKKRPPQLAASFIFDLMDRPAP
jgi:hypothetical protein